MGVEDCKSRDQNTMGHIFVSLTACLFSPHRKFVDLSKLREFVDDKCNLDCVVMV